MSTIKVSLFLKKKNAADDFGFIALKALIPGKGRVIKSLKYKVKVADWDKKGECVKSTAKDKSINPRAVNADIIRIKSDLIQSLTIQNLENKTVSKHSIKKNLTKGKASEAFLPYLEDYIKGQESIVKTRKGTRTKKSAGYTLKFTAIKNWIVKLYGNDLVFGDINTEWLQAFEKEASVTMSYETTLPEFMGRFIRVLSHASKRGYFDLITIADYERPKYVRPERVYLTLGETDKLLAQLYENTFPEDWKVITAFFLVECYSGIRFSDWKNFDTERLIHNDSLFIRRTQKTKESIYLPLNKSPRLAKVLAYIKENGIKFTMSEKTVNKWLKHIGKAVKINKTLTTHVGRHTCATLLLELGYSLEATAAFLGISVGVVGIYAKTTRRKVRLEYDKFGGL